MINLFLLQIERLAFVLYKHAALAGGTLSIGYSSAQYLFDTMRLSGSVCELEGTRQERG